ncbi:hypothetical protein A2U01_0049118, partial [Trifolium medium]|nr:hypothetical protein [Trifolium medium]
MFSCLSATLSLTHGSLSSPTPSLLLTGAEEVVVVVVVAGVNAWW